MKLLTGGIKQNGRCRRGLLNSMHWNCSYNITLQFEYLPTCLSMLISDDTPERKTSRKHLIFYEAGNVLADVLHAPQWERSRFKLPCSETKGQLGGNNISDISHHRKNITSALLRWYKSAKLLLTRIITIKQIHSRGRVVVVKSLIIRSVWAYNTYFITPL